MLEKLLVGDRVMNIPAKTDQPEDFMLIPYGASGTVVAEEGMHKCTNPDGTVTVEYGCLLQFDNHPPCDFVESGNWFRNREGLMKITPEKEMEEEERNVIAEDALPPLFTVDQLRQLFADRGENA